MRRVIIDVDPTEDPVHGQQEFEFFNGHYGCHCYLPVHVHITGDDGRQRILASLLRPGNSGPTRGLYSALRIAIRLIRARMPQARIILLPSRHVPLLPVQHRHACPQAFGQTASIAKHGDGPVTEVDRTEYLLRKVYGHFYALAFFISLVFSIW